MDINIETQFIKNTDTPDTYVGQAGKTVAVNQDETALEFVETDLPEQDITVLLMTAGNLSFNPIYDNGVDGVGATLTATANGILRDTSGSAKIDSVDTPEIGEIIWVKDRTNAIENGAYEITDRGSASTTYILTRPEGYNEMPELYPLQVNVLFGNANKESIWLQKTVDPVIGVDPIVVARVIVPTQLLPIRFIDTATSEPLPPYTFNPTTNIMTFDNVGYFGSLNGCEATLNTNVPNGCRTFLVKDEIDPKFNGTYQWINVGSSVIAPSAVRLDVAPSQFSRLNRTFLVSNVYSTLYGKQYCVATTTPPLTNVNLNTVPINFVENYSIDSTPTNGSENAVSSNGVFDALETKENTIASGTTSQYFRGDKTWQTLNKTAVGLPNVDNTSDANKPISTATQTALNAKQDTLVSGTNIKTVGGISILGSGNIPITASITVGATPITSGTVGRVLFQATGDVIQQDSNLFWDNTNKRLGVGATPNTSTRLDVRAQGALSTDIAFRVRNSADNLDLLSVRGNESIFFGNATGARLEIIRQSGGEKRVTLFDQFDTAKINLDSLNNSINISSYIGKIVLGDGVGSGSRFGIVGEGSNTAKIQAIDPFGSEYLSLKTNLGTGVSNFVFRDNNGTLTSALNNSISLSNVNDSYFGFVVSNKGNVAIGGNSHPAVGRSTFSIFNGVIPTTTVVDSFTQYSADIVAGNAVPHFRTENGNIIKLYRQTSSGVATVADLVLILQNLGLLS